jgi:16S rRNA (cytidine1402-2'-O)-methyltransferase
MGTLYIVSTPIGNLEDITIRAGRVLLGADVIACEDTRKTGVLLQSLRKKDSSFADNEATVLRDGKKTRLVSFYEGNEKKMIPKIIDLLKTGKNVALTSNAGTPLVADPGFKLVRECLRQGIQVQAIPGPSAVLAALVSSGLPTDKFYFWGFLPKKAGKRNKYLGKIKSVNRAFPGTNIIYLSPHRIFKELDDLKAVFGNVEAVVCRELTKIHEEIKKGRVNILTEELGKNKPRGEFTFLFNTKKAYKISNSKRNN